MYFSFYPFQLFIFLIQFHRNISKEYSDYTRAIGLELLKAIWEGLGIEENRVADALKLGSCFQILVGNLYPPYPKPDIELGFAPHSDHGFLTLLYQNGIDGLQIMHKERWIYVKPVPNSVMVNTGDHLEVHEFSTILRTLCHLCFI